MNHYYINTEAKIICINNVRFKEFLTIGRLSFLGKQRKKNRNYGKMIIAVSLNISVLVILISVIPTTTH